MRSDKTYSARSGWDIANETVDDAFGGIAACVLMSSASAATQINNVLAAAVDVLLIGVNKVPGDQTTLHQAGVDVAEAGGETMISCLRLCDISKRCGRRHRIVRRATGAILRAGDETNAYGGGVCAPLIVGHGESASEGSVHLRWNALQSLFQSVNPGCLLWSVVASDTERKFDQNILYHFARPAEELRHRWLAYARACGCTGTRIAYLLLS